MRIYVASSWRNRFQQGVVEQLRKDGHEVYDFKGVDERGVPGGFNWREVDKDWLLWNVSEYLRGLRSPQAVIGFNREMAALRSCEACVYVMPCGVSASLEAGWAKGAGKLLIVYVPELREPDLMVKMADLVTGDFEQVRRYLWPLPMPLDT